MYFWLVVVRGPTIKKQWKEKIDAYAMKREISHRPAPWLIEPANRLENSANFCPGCSFLH